MSWPDYVRRIPPETYTNILYSAAQLGATHAAAMALRGTKRTRGDWESIPRNSSEVGSDPQGPGVCRSTNSSFNTYIQDPSILRINKRGSRWNSNFKDKRDLLHRLLWPRHMINRIKDLLPLASTGSTARSKIISNVLYDNDTVKAIAMTANALANNSGAAGGTTKTGGIIPGAGQEAVEETITLGMPDTFGTIQIPILNTRFRLRNTSNRNARLRMYEFTCKSSCSAAHLPRTLWAEALVQKAPDSTVYTAAAAVATLTETDGYQVADTTMYLPETPYMKPSGYGTKWRITNTFTADLKPGKQLVYTTSCEARTVQLKRLNVNMADNGIDGNLSGVTKVVMFILIGDVITNNGATIGADAGDFGFSDANISLEQEDQFVTSLVWLQRPKTLYLAQSSQRGVGNYYHLTNTVDQGGTASGVSETQAAYAPNLN